MKTINFIDFNIIRALFLILISCSSLGAHGENNLNIVVSEKLLNKTIPIQQVDRIYHSEPFEGYETNTNAVSVAKPRLFLVPNDSEAQIGLMILGQVNASTTIATGEAVIEAATKTLVESQKMLYFSNNGWRSDLAESRSQSKSRITAVRSLVPFPISIIVEAIAWQKARSSLPILEAKMSQTVSNRYTKQLNEFVDTRFQLLDPRNFFKAVSNTVVRERLLQFLNFSTSSRFLQVYGDVRFGDPSIVERQARPLAPSTDLGFQVHQTLINSVSQVLEGALMTLKDLVDLFQIRIDDFPGGLEPSAVTMTFAQESAMQIQLENNKLKLRANLDRLELADEMLHDVVLEFSYGVKVKNSILTIEQLEKPSISRRLSVPNPDLDVEFSLLSSKFAQVLQSVLLPKYELKSLADLRFVSLPDSLPLKELNFSEAKIEAGWMNIAFSGAAF